MIELYEKKFIPEELIESGIRNLLKEDDTESVSTARAIAQIADLVAIDKGRMTLTAECENLLDSNDRFGLFKKYFLAYTEKFDWANCDNFTSQPVGQVGWAFSLMMFHKFGLSKPTEFYVEKYATAFPKLFDSMPKGFFGREMSFHFCYTNRVFDYFFPCFGFVTFEKQPGIKGKKADIEMHKTDVIQKLFKIEDF